MRILVDGEWRDGFLDYWRAPDEVRIQVRVWVTLCKLDELYFEFEPRRSLRRLWDYTREVGPREVVRKVASRLSESDRNEKFVAAGIGEVVQGPGVGRQVAFVAPCHPRCCERVCLPEELVRPWDGAQFDDGEIRLGSMESQLAVPERLRGWQRESEVDLEDVADWVTEVTRHLGDYDSSSADVLDSPATAICERREAAGAEGSISAVLFGWGHYARTCLLPNLPDGIEVSQVHEQDPVLSSFEPVTDTSPVLRDDEHADVMLAAGYHSTHAPLASDALKRGMYVVSEKPLATTAEQVDRLLANWEEPSRYFAGFHRRYGAFNEWLLQDLEPGDDDPISYHCLVHEVSLPDSHWYRWPSSGSRMLSNGCHWVDHFLYLNDFAEVASCEARRVGDEVSASVELVNGAVFTMTLTDRGSDRLGTREHTEVRVGDRTAVIEDGRSYRSESSQGLIRREKFHKLAAHAAMYRSIGERIIRGEPGDSRRSVERSARTALRLDHALDD